jgi:hypothetical protein
MSYCVSLFLNLGGRFRYGCTFAGQGEVSLLHDATDLQCSGVAFARMVFAGMIPLNVLARSRFYSDILTHVHDMRIE